MIGLDPGPPLLPAVGPVYDHCRDGGGLAKARLNPAVTGRGVTAIRLDPAPDGRLPHPLDGDHGADSLPVARLLLQAHLQPVRSGGSLVDQQADRAA